MITTDSELQATRARISRHLDQIELLRSSEENVANFRASAEGFLSEVDEMMLDVREYLLTHPSEALAAASKRPDQ
jgi:hypothetical protein